MYYGGRNGGFCCLGAAVMGGRVLTAGCSAVGGDGIAGFVVWRQKL